MGHLKLEDLIADLTDDGVLDSSGDFTLDPSKAEEKLKNFALSSPQDYILKVIQFAVASEASGIWITILPSKVEIVFDGQPVEEADLQSMMAHLLAERHDPARRRIRHLAAAMRGALGVEPSSVEYKCWDGAVGWARSWNAAGWKLEPLSLKGKPAIQRFVVERKMSQSLSSAVEETKAFFQGKSRTPEEEYLVKPCGRCPIPIVLDGHPLPRVEFGRARYQGYEIARDPNPGEMKPPPYLHDKGLVAETYDAFHHLIEICHPCDPKEPTSLPVPPTEATIREGLQPGEEGRCRSWLALEAALGKPLITVVSDGVVVMEKEMPAGDYVAGFRAILAGELFGTDLTGLQVTEDRRFQETLEWMQAESKRMRQKVLDSLHLFPRADWLSSHL